VAHIRTKLIPTGQMQLSRTMLAVLAVLVIAVVGVLVVAQRKLPTLSTLLARPEPEPLRKVDLPDVLKQPMRPYVELTTPKPAIPVAQAVPKTPQPPAPAAAPAPVAPPSTPPVQAQTTAPPDWLQMYMDQQKALTQAAARPPHEPTAGTPRAETTSKPKREPWIITPTDITLKRPESEGKGKEGKEKSEDGGKKEGGQLIHHATWERPAEPWKTLYMSQQLVGKTLDAVNSDEPGITRIELTRPVLAKEYDYEILPQGSIVIVRQEGKPNFGASTLAVKVVQIEPPGWRGEVISFKGSVGDENGASGLRGKTNFHYDKLLYAAGINAIMSLGSNSLAGTPGGGQYYQNPAQQSARDASQSVQNDVKSLTQAQLKVPPTITKKKGEIVTIQVDENVTFNRRAKVIR
jgi:type IV secretory pathway VirB10-like protein